MNRSRSSRIGPRESWVCGWATAARWAGCTRRRSWGRVSRPSGGACCMWGCRERSLYLTPSQLEWEGALPGVPLPHPLQGAPQGVTHTTSPALASALGSLVHKVLENWRYRDEIKVMLEQLNEHVDRSLPDEFRR